MKAPIVRIASAALACFALLASAPLTPPARAAASPAPADSSRTTVPPAPHLGRGDAFYALAAAGAVALAASEDRRWSAQATADHSRFALDLAADARALGDHVYVAPGLLAVDVAARLTHHDGVASATERIALAVGVAGATSLALKLASGRSRPDQARDEPWHFAPFSNHDSFPSGHSTIAFGLAAALDAETRTRWVPLIAYPAATLTAWSRVRDRRHWPSDVVAGAMLSGWVARRTDQYAQHRWPRGMWAVVWPARGGGAARVGVRF